MKFSIKDFFSKRDQIRSNGKLYFLCIAVRTEPEKVKRLTDRKVKLSTVVTRLLPNMRG